MLCFPAGYGIANFSKERISYSFLGRVVHEELQSRLEGGLIKFKYAFV
jgi:hypothetical protein